jgi:hypothetical protein
MRTSENAPSTHLGEQGHIKRAEVTIIALAHQDLNYALGEPDYGLSWHLSPSCRCRLHR